MDPKPHLGSYDIATIVLYFAIILIVGLVAVFKRSKNTVSGFFLAGRHMTWIPVGASLFASNIGSEHFIGLAGTGAASGIAVGAFEFNALVLLQLLGFVFLPVYIASKVCTLPEYMKKRFGGNRISIYLAFLSLILYIFTKISVNLYSAALFLQQILEVNIYLSAIALFILASIFSIFGGLTAVIYIDVAQVLIMLAGSSVLFIIGINKVGGWSSLQEKYIQAIPNVTYVNPNSNETCGVPGEDSWVLLREPFGSDMPWPGFLLGQTPASIWYWCADQIMVQKALSARSLSDAQGGTILTGWIKVLPMFLIVIPGMISRVLYPNEVGCVDPEICQKVCQNSVGCSNIAYPRLVLGIMPEGLRGLMMAVMVAGLMSDLTAIFNSASALFTMDIYRKFRPGALARELLLTGRVCILALVGVSICWIPIIQEMQGGQLYIYIQSIAAYLSPPIAAVFCLAISWKRMNEKGAFWSLMIGLVIGIMRMFLDFYFREPPCMEIDDRPAIVSKVHYMYFAAFLFNITILVAIFVSLVTKPDEEFRLIRATFWTRFDLSPRPDDEQCVEKVHVARDTGREMVPLNSLPVEDEDASVNQPPGKHGCLQTWFQAIFVTNDKDLAILEAATLKDAENIDKLANLHQTPKQKAILYTNLILILAGAVLLYVGFSINPFTSEEILELRHQIFLNRTTS